MLSQILAVVIFVVMFVEIVGSASPGTWWPWPPGGSPWWWSSW